MKIKITILRENASVVASLDEKMAPVATKLFVDKLPIRSQLFHARWCGNEVWTPLGNLGEYKSENQTIFPAIGELLIVPAGENYNFGIWYGKGWCFGPDGYNPGTVIGKIETDISEFAKAANDVLMNGVDTIIIEKM